VLKTKIIKLRIEILVAFIIILKLKYVNIYYIEPAIYL